MHDSSCDERRFAAPCTPRAGKLCDCDCPSHSLFLRPVLLLFYNKKKNTGEMERSIQEHITEINKSIDAFSYEEMKDLLKLQRCDLEEMLWLETQNGL